MKKKNLFIVSILWFFTLNCFGQNKQIDSLQLCLKTAKEDTSKVNTFNLLVKEYINKSDYFIADSIAQRSLIMAEKLNFKIGEANALGYIGFICFYKGEYDKSLEYSRKALKIDEELKNKRGIANRLGKIANVYFIRGDYPRALDYNFKAKKIAEELEGKNGVENYLSNIGLVYMKKGDYPKALDYYFLSLKIVEDLKDKRKIAVRLTNIAIIYKEQGDYLKSLEYNSKTLKLAEETGDKSLAATVTGNMGAVYLEQGDYSKALINLSKALEISKELNDKHGIARHLSNIGNLYSNKGDFSKALDYHSEAFEISKEIDDKDGISAYLINSSDLLIKLNKYKEAYNTAYKAVALSDSLGLMSNVKLCYDNLSDLYEKSNIPLPDTIGGKVLNMEHMRLRSMYYYKRSIAIRDTLFSQETKKELVRKEMNYEFDKKEAITKAENEKQQAIVEEKNRKQKIITWSVVFGLLFVVVFAGFIFRSLKITRKQKQIIEIKNTETELQKRIIEEANKDITDSIRYAKRIQDALMGEQGHVSMHLPEHFILFMPKDIVSGDFHWGAEKNGCWYFAAVDCTGHGVPGAVMSMLGISFLNDIVSSEQLLKPSEVLNRLRDKVIKELRQTGEAGGSKDGMDISLCRLDLATNELQWAGAYNPLNLFRNGQLEELKADKQPIGYHPENHPFTNHEIQLQKGDSIYIYSDGYADQFGGPKGKKIKYKQLEDLIIANYHLPLKDQKEILNERFIEWKGALEQVDDVCVFGVRV
jgi:tetratricopeptide (TPR) repeat protein